MKNLKITKGEWRLKTNVHPNTDGTKWGWLGTDFSHPQDIISGVNVTWSEGKTSEANAQLIADAGTTANKCGKLPSELLAERDELLEALKKVDAFIKKNEDVNYWCRLLQREVDTDSIITKITGK